MNLSGFLLRPDLFIQSGLFYWWIMKSLFDSAFELLIKHEGGYVNDPADPGGETIYGISRRAHPDAWLNGAPTIEQAKAIYFKHYWQPLRCDEFPPALAVVLFDTGVNAGNSRAVQLLQKVIGIKDDGIIGPQTIGAVAKQTSIEGLVNNYCAERILFNSSLSTWPRFGRGWTRRIIDMAVKSAQISK